MVSAVLYATCGRLLVPIMCSRLSSSEPITLPTVTLSNESNASKCKMDLKSLGNKLQRKKTKLRIYTIQLVNMQLHDADKWGIYRFLNANFSKSTPNRT